MIDVLEVHFKISSTGIFQEKEIEQVKPHLAKAKLSYKEFEELATQYFGMLPQVKNMLKGTDEALKLEVGLLVANLILEGELEIPNSQFIGALNHFLKRTISQYGAYNIVNGLWKPDQDDTSQLVTNMRILSSALMVEMGQSTPISKDGLSKFILS